MADHHQDWMAGRKSAEPDPSAAEPAHRDEGSPDQAAAETQPRPQPSETGRPGEADRQPDDDQRGTAAAAEPFGGPPPGLPRLFGQQPPFGTRTALGPQPPYPEPSAGLGGTGPAAVPGTEDPYRRPGESARDLVSAYDMADAYGPPDGYDTADAYGPPDGYDTAEGYRPLAEYASSDSNEPPAPLAPSDIQATPYPRDEPGSQAEPTGQAQPDVQPDPYAHAEAQDELSTADGPRHEPSTPDAPGTDAEPRDEPSIQDGPSTEAEQQVQPPPEPYARRAALAPLPGLAPAAPPPKLARPGLAPRPVPAAPHSTVTAESLTADLLLPGRHKAPSGGWRRMVYQATGGLVRAPQSATEVRRRELTARARTPVTAGHHRVAVMSLKGGVGKTTTTMGLGSTLASLRGDRVIAVDANPDRGTLSDKLRLETAATIRDLLNEKEQIRRYADVRGYTTQAASRLEVLASDRDPTVSVAFSEADYCDVTQVLEHYYSICITDCGTGLLHSAMTGVLRLADQIVLVSSPSVDGARSASATLDWLQAHGYGDLVRNAVVVLSVVRPRSKSTVDMDRLEQHFAARCRAVARIPYDPHLEEGAEVDLAQLNRATADAYLALAAEVGDGFAVLRRGAKPS